LSAALRRSFNSLQIPNYRRYFAGQIVSLSGNWMQMVAEMWLILELTGSGVAVGVTSALQFLPILLFGAWGGVLADRLPKRSLLIATQAAMALPALVLWGLTTSGAVEPWMVFGLVLVRGSINAIDNPTRQSFVIEMVGADRVVNAVGLNSVLVHSARIFGPAGAGLLIATVGVAPCFLLNSVTFAAMIVALRGMDAARLRTPKPDREHRGVRAALAYVRSEPTLLIPMAMMAVVGTLAFNFQVLLPLLGRFTFDGGAGAYTALAMAMALGSIAGALTAGARARVGERLRAARFGPARRRQRHLRRRDQLNPAARGERRDARQGDGALFGRLPRLDSDRRAARGLACSAGGPARGPGARRRRGAGYGRGGLVRLREAIRREPGAAGAASPRGLGRGRGPGCGPTAAARTPTRARRRSAPRRAPRSPRPPPRVRAR
jgi:MFS family permease